MKNSKRELLLSALIASPTIREAARVAGIPESTAATPLIMWVSGFLEDDSELGKEATIRTKMNRTESGVVEVINPTTDVDYGEYIPEIAQIGTQAREILWGGN